MSRPAPRLVSAVCLLSMVFGTFLLAQTPPPKPPVKKKPAAVPAKAAPAPVAVAPAPKPLPPPPPSDVRVQTRYTRGAEVSENTTYIRGARQRVEFPGVVTLDQCDLNRAVLLNIASKKYLIRPYALSPATTSNAPPAAAPASATDSEAVASMGMMGQGGQPQPAKGGVITYTATLTDTLERKTLFGNEARRIRTVIVKQPSASACDKAGLKVEVDGWYVDLPQSAGCTKPQAAPEAPPAPSPDVCVDRVEARTVGDAKLGFPVAMVTTTTTGDGDKQEVSSTSMEVTDLEVTRLDAALFEVPPDFVEANSSTELVPTLAAGGSLAETLFGSTADGTSNAAPKKPGTIRVGVLEPANKTSRTLAARQLREHLVGDFRKAPFEALALAGASAADVQQDAARLQCDYILFSEVTDVKTSKPGKVGGLLKRVAHEDATRDIYEVKLDYKLYAVGGPAAPAATGSSKASSGGGVGVGTVLKVAAFAGRMYLSMYGMGGLGMGMMNPLMSMPGLGGGGGPFSASGLFDPRMTAMSSMTQMVGMGGMSGSGATAGAPGDDGEATLTQTVGSALSGAAKNTMEQLQGRKK
jgi:hypothetical protein